MILPDLLDAEGKAARFRRICNDAMSEHRSNGEDGVGTLAEKWQHQIIKRYLTENADEHEIGIPGRRFVADVRVGDHIYEVQTASFRPMLKKLTYCLEATSCRITVVHPIAKNTWVSYINEKTEEISPRKRSPRHGRAIDLLPMLYPLLPILPDPRLDFRLLLLEVHDFRLTTAKGRRAGKFERIPLELLEDRSLRSPSDFKALLPPLPEVFSVREFSSATRLRGIDAYSAVRVLAALGVLREITEQGKPMRFCFII